MALMDCVSGIFIFIGPVRATILGYDPLVAGSMVTARAVFCCLSTFIIARWLNSRNAPRFLFAANALYFCAAMLGIWATNLSMLYVTSSLAGVFMSIFSASFQVFMKDVDSSEHRPLSRVVGAYTFAWCVGMSFGPFITGALMQLGKPADGGESIGWLYAYLAAATMILATFITLLWVRSVSRDHMTRRLAAAAEDGADVSEGRGRPDLAWLGWTMAMLGSVVLGVVRAVFPAGATAAGMAEWRSGLMMMMVAACMGVSAFLYSRGKDWLYSGGRMFAVGLVGTAGLGLYALPRLMGWGMLDHYAQFYVAAILAGCYSGIVYLYSAFHALIHPEHAGRNIALNECVLALGMTLGTLGGGWLAKHYGFYPPFVAASLVACALGAFQWWAHRRAEK